MVGAGAGPKKADVIEEIEISRNSNLSSNAFRKRA